MTERLPHYQTRLANLEHQVAQFREQIQHGSRPAIAPFVRKYVEMILSSSSDQAGKTFVIGAFQAFKQEFFSSEFHDLAPPFLEYAQLCLQHGDYFQSIRSFGEAYRLAPEDKKTHCFLLAQKMFFNDLSLFQNQEIVDVFFEEFVVSPAHQFRFYLHIASISQKKKDFKITLSALCNALWCLPTMERGEHSVKILRLCVQKQLVCPQLELVFMGFLNAGFEDAFVADMMKKFIDVFRHRQKVLESVWNVLDEFLDIKNLVLKSFSMRVVNALIQDPDGLGAQECELFDRLVLEDPAAYLYRCLHWALKDIDFLTLHPDVDTYQSLCDSSFLPLFHLISENPEMVVYCRSFLHRFGTLSIDIAQDYGLALDCNTLLIEEMPKAKNFSENLDFATLNYNQAYLYSQFGELDKAKPYAEYSRSLHMKLLKSGEASSDSLNKVSELYHYLIRQLSSSEWNHQDFWGDQDVSL